MVNRILTNWTFIRIFYLIIGIALIAQSATSRHWFGVALGGYFAAMGLFAFGCASGNCFGRNCKSEPNIISTTQDVDYEEVKSK